MYMILFIIPNVLGVTKVSYKHSFLLHKMHDIFDMFIPILMPLSTNDLVPDMWIRNY